MLGKCGHRKWFSIINVKMWFCNVNVMIFDAHGNCNCDLKPWWCFAQKKKKHGGALLVENLYISQILRININCVWNLKP